MNERYTYWWQTRSECPRTVKIEDTIDSMKIKFNSMAGVFIIFASSVVISLALLVIEVKFKWLVEWILEAGV